MVEFFDKAIRVSMSVGFGLVLAVVVLFQPVLANVDANSPNAPRIMGGFCLVGIVGAVMIGILPVIFKFCADVAFLQRLKNREQL